MRVYMLACVYAHIINCMCVCMCVCEVCVSMLSKIACIHANIFLVALFSLLKYVMFTQILSAMIGRVKDTRLQEIRSSEDNHRKRVEVGNLRMLGCVLVLSKFGLFYFCCFFFLFVYFLASFLIHTNTHKGKHTHTQHSTKKVHGPAHTHRHTYIYLELFNIHICTHTLLNSHQCVYVHYDTISSWHVILKRSNPQAYGLKFLRWFLVAEFLVVLSISQKKKKAEKLTG